MLKRFSCLSRSCVQASLRLKQERDRENSEGGEHVPAAGHWLFLSAGVAFRRSSRDPGQSSTEHSEPTPFKIFILIKEKKYALTLLLCPPAGSCYSLGRYNSRCSRQSPQLCARHREKEGNAQKPATAGGAERWGAVCKQCLFTSVMQSKNDSNCLVKMYLFLRNNWNNKLGMLENFSSSSSAAPVTRQVTCRGILILLVTWLWAALNSMWPSLCCCCS